ncbi:uridine kinase [Phyllobacterium sp. SB3]|uniref:uridine kinase n=1 Tax=Phyllobacterium sp. SB3 TaxID=3156073 RepID=UPI0032AED5DB
MNQSGRIQLLERIARAASSLENDRTIVAIDGVDGSGKTIFANELAATLKAQGQAVIRASVDGFHNPRNVRYLRGKDNPEGYFLDSYNYETLKNDLLIPFLSGRDQINTAHFDHRTDQEILSTFTVSEKRTILVFDGIFLHRDELYGLWDLSLFLDVAFHITYARMAVRDGSNIDPFAPENHRYLKGQHLYLRECSPKARATLVIDNSSLDVPRIL